MMLKRLLLLSTAVGWANAALAADPNNLPANSIYAAPSATTGPLNPRLMTLADILVGASCTTGQALYDNAGAVGCQAFPAGSLSTSTTFSGSPTTNFLLYVNGSNLGFEAVPASTLVGASTVISGTCPTTQVLYNNAGVLGCEAATGTGTVTNVAVTVPSFLAIAGSPITTTGTLAFTLNTQTANTFFAGPTSAGPSPPTFRSLAPADVAAYIPNLSASVQATSIPGMDDAGAAGTSTWFIYNAPALVDGTLSGSKITPSLRVQRQVTGTGGNNIYDPGTILSITQVPTTDSNFEWGVNSQINNNSLAATGSQNVAVAGTIFKQGAGAQVGFSWGLFGQCVDQTTTASPTAGCIGAELDSGTPALNGGTDPNKQRVILQLAATGLSGTHVGYGVLLGSQTAGSVIDTGFQFNGIGTFGTGIDLSSAGTFGSTGILFAGHNQQGFGWKNDAGNFSNSGTSGSAFFKGPGTNYQYFDNYDVNKFLFRGVSAASLGVIQSAALGGAQFVGTNQADSAATGFNGEYLSNTGTAVALTSTVISDITSKSLTAGDWECRGNVTFNPAAGTTQTNEEAWVSVTSATRPATPYEAYSQFQASIGAALAQTAPTGTLRVNVNTTTTVYLSGVSTFAVSTESASGFLGCRRIR